MTHPMITRSKWRMYLQSLIDFRMSYKKRRHSDDDDENTENVVIVKQVKNVTLIFSYYISSRCIPLIDANVL